jgi:murein DD-endopeptidase MepM/ murein hydrolase activator NlpD
MAVAFSLSCLGTPAMADGPTSTPSVSPSPSAPAPAASPTSSPSPTDASAAATAAPTPSPTADPEAARAEAEAARARDAALLANARSLAQVIEAQARVAQDELAGLDPQIAQVAKDLDAVNADIADLQAKSNARRTLHDRLVRDAFQLAAMPADKLPADLSSAQREALDDLLSLQNGLLAAQTKLTERADLLATLKGSVGAKQAQLARLRDRARSLAAAAAAGDTEAKAAQVAVLTALAQDATNAQTALAQLVASAMVRDGESGAWSLPVRGVLTQPFGPTSLELEPPATFDGVSYAHFHAAVDLAAPLGTPVTAASDGVVAFVGHLPDGAMIALIAHPGGYVSEYAHLDDTFALPPVKAGQAVKTGQVIGFIGLTGITTGAHLHFAVMKDGTPVDPLSVLSER